MRPGEFFYSKQQCEVQAAELLVRYQRLTGLALEFPIDVDLIGEELCHLTFDWYPIPEKDGKPVWARLLPAERLVQMNESRKAALCGNSGLDRFSRGHEVGHWELHAIQPNPEQLSLLDVAPSREAVFCRGNDGSWIEKHAEWFAAALLMPRDLFKDAAGSMDLALGPNVKALQNLCDVSYKALSIRLDECGCRWVDHDGVLHNV